MNIKTLPVGELGTNCYILMDEQTRDTAVIDPGDEAGRIFAQLQQDGARVRYILLTHGHFDHTTGVPSLHTALPEAQVYIHEADAPGTGRRLFPLAEQVEDLHLYNEGDCLDLGSLTIRVMHTPGHSLGSVVLHVGDVLFTGDTLFAGTCGRTDLPGGNFGQMMDSLARLGRIEGNLRVLPGHGEEATLDWERQYNAYMIQALSQR